MSPEGLEVENRKKREKANWELREIWVSGIQGESIRDRVWVWVWGGVQLLSLLTRTQEHGFLFSKNSQLLVLPEGKHLVTPELHSLHS